MQNSSLDWEAVCAEVGDSLLDHFHPSVGVCSDFKTILPVVHEARVQFYSGTRPPVSSCYPDDELSRAQSTHRIWTYVLDHSFKSTAACAFDDCYKVVDMVMDEEKALESPAAPVLRAAWKAARLLSDHWWPLLRGVVLTERPAEIHRNDEKRFHRLDGPAVVYRDGFGQWAFEGTPVRENWMLHPEDIPASELRDSSPAFRRYVQDRIGKLPPKPKLKSSAILKTPLPANSAERVELLRQHNDGRLPLFDRYLEGDHQKVWEELVALGGSVREDPRAADALAVAYEIMTRVGANIRTITGRLGALGYKFAKRKPHTPPVPKTAAQVARLEKKAGTLPLSLRAFYEVVGAVDWTGQHPMIAPPKDSNAPDPLVVYAAGDALKFWSEEGEDGEPGIVIAPDALHKADISGGGPYRIGVPELRADGPLLDESHELFLVDYLRLVFQFGGFPGYDGVDPMPEELLSLSAGLIEI